MGCKPGINFLTINRSLNFMTTSGRERIKCCRRAGRMKWDRRVVLGSRPKVGDRDRLTMTRRILLVLVLSLCSAGCGGAGTAPTPSSGYRIYITNERSGDLSIIDSKTHGVTATVPLGKRPRGIHASPDRQTIYVALSGSPIAGPGVDESKLPPSDKKADGIGVFNVRENKLVKVIPGGSDPEEFDLSKDGSLLYSSNEDAAQTSVIDIAAGKVIASIPVGEEPEGVTTSPDGKFVFVTSENDGTISVIDAAARKVI